MRSSRHTTFGRYPTFPGPTEPLSCWGVRSSHLPGRASGRPPRTLVGMTTVRDQACFGVYVDRAALPDAGGLATTSTKAVASFSQEHASRAARPIRYRMRRRARPRPGAAALTWRYEARRASYLQAFACSRTEQHAARTGRFYSAVFHARRQQRRHRRAPHSAGPTAPARHQSCSGQS